MAKDSYFGPGLFRFLKELKLHNEREWFLANRQRYEEEVRQPFLRLIADLVLSGIDKRYMVWWGAWRELRPQLVVVRRTSKNCDGWLGVGRRLNRL